MKKQLIKLLTVMFCILSTLSLCFGFAACGDTKATYSVTTNYDTSQGTITLDPAANEDGKYEEDTQVTITVTANSGYTVDTFTVSTDPSAKLEDGNYTLTVTGDTTIKATFKPTAETDPVEKFTLTYSSGEHGTIALDPESTDGKYDKDTTIAVTLTPDEGYEVDTFTVDDENKTGELQGNVYTFDITKDTAIAATFKPTEERYTLTLPQNVEHGTITVTPEAGADGKYDKDTKITVTLTPESVSFMTSSFKVNGEDKTEDLVGEILIKETTYPFSITADTTIDVRFVGHSHSWIKVVEATAEGETVACMCRATEDFDHNFGDWTDAGENCKRSCTHTYGGKKCPYEETAEHEYAEWKPFSETMHSGTCSKCGHEMTEEHDKTGENDACSKCQYQYTAYTLTLPQSVEHGTITVTPEAGADGKYANYTLITVTFAPEENYTIDTFTVGSEDKAKDVKDNVYTFNITGDTTIAVTFKSAHECVDKADTNGYRDGLCDICNEIMVEGTDKAWNLNSGKLTTGAYLERYAENYKKIKIPTTVGTDKTDVTSVTMAISNIYTGGVTDIIVPNGKITSIKFANLSKLTSVVLLQELTELKFGTFVGCPTLQSLVLPKTITKINDGAFNGSTKPTAIDIYFMGEQESWNTIYSQLKESGIAKSIIDAEGSHVRFYKESQGTDKEWHWEIDQVKPAPWATETTKSSAERAIPFKRREK